MILVRGNRPLLLSREAQMALTGLGCLAGAALATCLMECWGPELAAQTLPAFTLLHVPLLLIAPALFDRYLLVLLPGTFALAATGPGSRFRCVVGIGGLCLMGALSCALLHDFLAWNGARWELGRRAVGFEWDGWYSERAFRKAPRSEPGLTMPFNYIVFDHTGRYALSFSELPGTRTLDSQAYRLWLIPGDHHFYLVERQPPPLDRSGTKTDAFRLINIDDKPCGGDRECQLRHAR